MGLSEEEVRGLLGLKDPRIFRLERLRHLVAPEQVALVGVDLAERTLDEERGTGKTTNALVRALSLASRKRCCCLVVEDEIQEVHIYKELEDLGKQLGIDVSCVTIIRRNKVVYDC